MSIFQQIGQNIISLRKQKKITQEALALEAKMSPSYLRSIEHGKANPSLDTLNRIAEALHEPLISIFTASEYVMTGQLNIQ